MAKKFIMVIGLVFVLVGALGFFSNPIVGASGFFETNVTHNIAHLLIGVMMLAMAPSAPNTALNIFGVVYLLLAILGFVMTSPLLGLVAINSADNWLHVVLGVVLLVAGMTLKNEVSAMPMQPGMSSKM